MEDLDLSARFAIFCMSIIIKIELFKLIKKKLKIELLINKTNFNGL